MIVLKNTIENIPNCVIKMGISMTKICLTFPLNVLVGCIKITPASK